MTSRFAEAISGLLLLLQHCSSYNMQPLMLNASEMESSMTTTMLLNEVLDFEAMRSPTFSTIEGRVSEETVQMLCLSLLDDPDFLVDGYTTKMIEFVPIHMAPGYPESIFTQPCFAWIRKECAGTPKPPFDYRCHFWVPFIIHVDGAECKNSKDDSDEDDGKKNETRRKKRLAPVFEEIVISGLEAATLCATRKYSMDNVTDSVELKSLALPTNEAMQLRCVNWKLSPEGWNKIRLSPQACEIMNFHRPAGYVVNDEVTENDDGFADVITCQARNTLVDCMFNLSNIHDKES